MSQLNPTLVDGLWPWRDRLNEAAMVISTLEPQQTIPAAKELARELAQHDRAVVLTRVGASEPLFWHVPAGKELETVEPDLVLMLVHKHFAASTRLLLATAHAVVLITGSSPEDREQSLKMMQTIIQTGSPSHVEVVVVADRPDTAREASGHLLSMARDRFGDRTSWRHLSARKIRDAIRDTEEGPMALTKPRPVTLSEAELLAREWNESFHKAEQLLHEAHETLRRQLEKSAAPLRPSIGSGPPEAFERRSSPPDNVTEDRSQSV